MEIREMRASDRGAVLDLLEHAFGVRELFERYIAFDSAFADSDVSVAFENGRPVSCVQVFAKTIRLRREAVSLGGIGSVATHESQRGKGLASQLLRRAIERMCARGMALSLLFTGRFAFYEALGWEQISMRLFKLRAPAAPVAADDALVVRPFRPEDLPAVAALYDAYTEVLSGPTLRDERYWAGQLRTAGTPGEDFRVAEPAAGGGVVAYARAASFSGRTRVLEYARGPRGAAALARLLLGFAPAGHSLPVPLVRDAELGESLRALGVEAAPGEDSSAMWRVLDRATLDRIAGAGPGTSDRALLESLVGGPLVTYWPSDRF